MNPDPRLTAYALGELDPAERETFERDLAASAELQAELQTLIPLCDELAKTLPEETDALTPDQRAALRVRAALPAAAPRRRPGAMALGGSLAAAITFALGLGALFRPVDETKSPALSARRAPAPAAEATFAAAPTAPAVPPASESSDTAAITQKLERIILPRVDFREATVREALDSIRQLARNLDTTEPDGTKRGVAIAVKPNFLGPALEDSQRITLTLSDVPLGEALRYVATAAGMKLEITPRSVAVVPLNTAGGLLVTKEYRVSPGFLSDLDAAKAKLPPETDPRRIPSRAARELLASRGVTFPTGASAHYLASSGKLVVRNTPANLDLIDGLPLVSLPVKTETDAAIPRQLAEAAGFYETGRYDLASKRAEQVLAADKSNIPARRLLEKINVSRQIYAAETQNSTRSKMLALADNSRRSPVTQYSFKKDFAPNEPTLVAEVRRTEATAELPDRSALRLAQAETTSLPSSPAIVGGSAGLNKTIVTKQTTEFAGFSHDGSLQALGGMPPTPEAESYAAATPNAFLESRAQPLSTFSIDVDTASYANVRRFLTNGQLPPPDAVRLEELINYFPYSLPQPAGDAPFSVTTEVSRAPWNPAHLLARIALKGRDLDGENLPPSNLVFLVDVSGSMRAPNKLPLLKRSLRELVMRLDARDRVAIVTYAGHSGLALASTEGREQARILDAIDRLEAGGSTNGAAGIQLAYEQARRHFLRDGNNRVILCTDGDFNVGVTSRDELTTLIERERKSGVFLSVLGFGTGNLKDAQMENLADKGNGNYAYIDSPSEGRKVLVEQMGATLFAIAKDVKIQVEFNPATVAGYRLIGYENRLLAKEDFNDDTKDAGEIGAGHAVTALYEIVPAGEKIPGQPSVDPLKYQTPEEPAENRKSKIENPSSDLFTVKLRFKAPDGDTSRLIEKVVGPGAVDFAQASPDFRFAGAVAAFGMKLRGDRFDAAMSWTDIQRIARESLGDDAGSYRAEFLVLVEKAKPLGK